MSVVDDYGRYFADPGLLRGHLYPRQISKVSDSDVGKWLHSCVVAGLVRVYPAQDGERYLEIANFGQQVRALKSKFPNPPANEIICEHEKSNVPLDVSVSVSESVVLAPPGGFETFWKAYPKKKDIATARKAFDKLKPNPELLQTILKSVAIQAMSPDWQKEGGKFIPYPASWINGARWLDEDGALPLVENTAALETEKFLAKQRDQAEKSVPMPPEIKARLAGLFKVNQ
jgi:hypothetical protein